MIISHLKCNKLGKIKYCKMFKNFFPQLLDAMHISQMIFLSPTLTKASATQLTPIGSQL